MAKIAMLVDRDFSGSQLEVPMTALRDAGHDVSIVGEEAGLEIESWDGESVVTTDLAVREVDVEKLHALVIPGGREPGAVEWSEDMVELARDAVHTGILVASAGCGAELLVRAEVVRRFQMTSAPALQPALTAAGALWADRPVVEDGPFVTARHPADLDRFSQTLLARLSDEVYSEPASLHF
jgi:protease I